MIPMLYFRGELRNKIFAHFQGTFTLQWPPLTSWSSCSAYWGLYQLAIQCQRFTHIHLPVLGHWLPSPQNLPAHDSIFRSCARQDVGWHDMDTDGDIGIQSGTRQVLPIVGFNPMRLRHPHERGVLLREVLTGSCWNQHICVFRTVWDRGGGRHHRN